jgi:DNA-binding NtrC family response regulator
MGGVEAIQKLIEIDPDVKGIVSSGHSFNDVIVNYHKYGFCGAITKPFTKHGLITTVNELIENG